MIAQGEYKIRPYDESSDGSSGSSGPTACVPWGGSSGPAARKLKARSTGSTLGFEILCRVSDDAEWVDRRRESRAAIRTGRRRWLPAITV